jgi:hypothetical protein
MTVKPASELFREQMWRELQAAHKVKQCEQVKKNYDKHQEAVIVSLMMVKDKDGKRKTER